MYWFAKLVDILGLGGYYFAIFRIRHSQDGYGSQRGTLLNGVLFVYLGQSMTSEDIAFWSMVGTWVSGVATFLAVLISFFVAWHPRRVLIKATASVIQVLTGSRLASVPAVRFKLLNTGFLPVKIDTIGFARLGYGKRSWIPGTYHQIVFRLDPLNSAVLPRMIDREESIELFINLNDRPDWFSMILDKLVAREIPLNKLIFIATTASGKEILFDLSDSFMDKLRKAEEK